MTSMESPKESQRERGSDEYALLGRWTIQGTLFQFSGACVMHENASTVWIKLLEAIVNDIQGSLNTSLLHHFLSGPSPILTISMFRSSCKSICRCRVDRSYMSVMCPGQNHDLSDINGYPHGIRLQNYGKIHHFSICFLGKSTTTCHFR